MKQIVLLIILCLFFSSGLFSSSLKMELKKIFEVGERGNDIFFGEISSLAEDKDGNLYVADIKKYEIFKFSPEGKFVLSFGRKGEGPGEFRFRFYVAISRQNQVIVGEAYPYISTFDINGKYIEKINLRQMGLKGVFSSRYIDDNLFVTTRLKEGITYYALISLSPEPKIINDNLIASTELKSFKEVAMNDVRISPNLFFAYSGKYVAISDNDRYRIKIINRKGEIVNTIERSLEQPEFSPEERNCLIEDLVLSDKSLEPALKKGVINNLIPYKKCFITGLAVSNTHVFVERVKEDITHKDSPIPVDVFTLEGKFLGQIHLPALPLLASDKYMYLVENNSDDDVIISKYSYILSQ